MEKFVQNYYEYNDLNEAEETAKAELKAKEEKKAESKEEKKDDNQGSYEAYVRKMLAKYNVKSPSELEAAKKKEFYTALDNGWTSEEEKRKKK